jgi:MoaA/NifB/PqqE/SkfB family radical SAM enzyme
MDEFEVYRKAWNSYPKDEFVSNTPLHLDIELTNRCNRKCEECPYHGKGKDSIFYQESLDLDFELYCKIIDEVAEKGTKAIKFGFGGEPLLYNHIIEAIKYAKDKGILDVQINTNGDFLDARMCKKLVEAGLDLLILSDYGSNIQYLNAIMFNLARSRSTCKFHINKGSNVQKWHFADIVKPIIYYNYENIEEIFIPSKFKCPYPWQRFIVLANGNVMTCSCGSIYTEKIIGNIRNQSIEALWNSKKMKYLRFSHSEGLSHHTHYCRLCGLRNEWIKTGGVRLWD